jgi:DNA (cytosine-5)-methyltransferase 1
VKYLSVCSGIEAATVAWHPLGWKPVAFSEIEPFPCKVLAHHYPDVPNFGDMTKFKEWPDANVDVLVGGTPCQSFSIAGLRKGLDDPRGNLMLTYLAIAAKYRPKWVLWENVPGVLSSNGGRDFATFLRGLAECGYGYAYRVLDAQYVRTDGYPYAVPQRRRRVFVVGYFGDWRSAAAVLFDSESMQGNPAPSREKRERVAPTVGTGAPFGRTGNDRVESDALVSVGCEFGPAGGRLTDTSPTLDTRAKDGPVRNQLAGAVLTTNRMVAFGEYVDDDLAGALKQRDYKDATDLISYGIAGNIIGRQPQNGGNGEGWSEDVSYTLTKTDQHAVAFNWQGSAQQGASASENVTPTLDKSKIHAVMQSNMQVRRLTPTECARLQGFPDDYLSKVPGASDSAMYKALGNSMAVNVMQLIGQRIQMVHELQSERKAA